MTSDDLEDRLRESLARISEEVHQQSFQQFDSRALCWAALLPRWNQDLANDIGLSPPSGYSALIAGLDRAGLVERRIDGAGDDAEAGQPRETFWIRSRYRRTIGDYLRDQLGRGLESEYKSLCARVGELHTDDLRLWLTVRAFHADHSGRLLLDRVDSLLSAGDMPEAASTVATARLVSDVLGGTLENAVQRAQWRLDREYRIADDLDHLRTYFRRPRIEENIHRLITAGDDAPWVLHLMGAAGVGKTMVLRYLASGQLADDLGMARFPVVRVDFDHLDPRFPEQRPVELLVALTDQLLGFAPSREVEQYHLTVLDAADALHEELARPEPSRQRTKALIDDAVHRFARLVERLRAPVVLVLDTCEELAKLYTPGTSAPAIDRTFDLLEQLHDQVPGVRVVFAGRRSLVPPDTSAYAGPKLLPRPYVQVLPIAGFTAEEAARFLVSRTVPRHLHEAILTKSAMYGTDEYNPFELESCASWARADPDLSAADLINVAGDPYIERRILARIQAPPVLAALPVAVALGRFDRSSVSRTLLRLGIDPGAAFDGLAAQEWVHVNQLTKDGKPRVIEVATHIRERMRKVLRLQNIGSPVDERELGNDAAAVLRENPLHAAAVETVETAIRLLPAEDAAAVWDEVDRRLLEENDWGWALQVTSRVSATEAADRTRGPSVLAAILATQAAARVHTGQRHGMAELWQEVMRHASRHPDPARRETLSLRAELGQVAAGYPTDPVEWRALVDRLADRPDLADSLLAAVETLVADRNGLRRRAGQLHDAFTILDEQPVPQIRVQALILRIGVQLRTNQDARPRRLSALAVEWAESAASPVRRPDWTPPPGLLDRARLIRVLDALYGGPPVSEKELTLWRLDALRRRDANIDADRLIAATIDYELCHRLVPPEQLPEEVPHQAWDAVAWLHFGLGRPRVVAVAEALSAARSPRRAAELLSEHAAAALASGVDTRTVEACALSLLRVCRRHRTDVWAPVARLAHEGTPRVRDEAWLVRRLVNGVEPEPGQLGTDFGRWRCAPVFEPPDDPRYVPADHLDVWETAVLVTDNLDHPLLPDTNRARGTAAVMAGEVRALASPSRGSTLLYLAGIQYVEVDDEDAARDAFELADQLTEATTAVTSEPTPAAAPMLRTVVLSAVRRVRTYWYLILPALAASLPVGLAVYLRGDQGFVNSVLFTAAFTLLLLGVLAGLVRVNATFTPLDVVSIRSSSRSKRVNVRTEYSISLDERHPWSGPGIAPARGHTVARLDLSRKDAPMSIADVDVVARGPVLPLFRGTHPIALDIERGVQFSPWEQWLGRARFRGRSPLVFRLHERPSRAGSARRHSSFRGPAHLTPSASRDSETGLRLLHLVGMPVPTSAGTYFRVRGMAVPSEHTGPGRRSALVDIDEVAARGLTTLVLQAEPLDGPPHTLDESRVDFLRCAQAAVDSGVPTVLIVPPVDDAMAARFVNRIWDVATAPGLTNRAVMLLLAEMRRLIDTSEPDSRGADRASLDLILFHNIHDVTEHLPE